MANPYGITEFDAMGAINAYRTARNDRTQQMLLQRQIEREDAAAEMAAKRQAILSRVGTGGGDPASTPGAVAEGVTQPSGPTAPTSLVDPTQLPPRTDGIQLNQAAIRELYAIGDVETATQLQTAMFNANKQQFEAMERNGQMGLNIVGRLARLPESERAAELRRWAPELQQLGIDPGIIHQADLSDAGLDRYSATFRHLAKLRNVEAGATVMDEGRMDPNDPNAGVIYRSPLVRGADGTLYERTAPASGGTRPPSPPPPPQAIEELRRNPGTRAQFDEVFGAGAADRALGGASQTGSQTFP